MTWQGNTGKSPVKSLAAHVATYLSNYARIHVAGIEDADKCRTCGGTGLDKDRVGSFCLNIRWYWCPCCQGEGRLKGAFRNIRTWPRQLTAEEIVKLYRDPLADIR